MLKLKMALGFAATLTAGVALATAAQARDLTVVSWGGAYQDAQKKVYFEPFKKAAGLAMNDESWDGGIGVLRAKMQGGANNWDVVQVESEEVIPQVVQHLAAQGASILKVNPRDYTLEDIYFALQAGEK